MSTTTGAASGRDARYAAADEAARHGRLAVAEGELRRLLLDAPEDVPARRLLARTLNNGGLCDPAADEMRRALALDPQDAETCNDLALLLQTEGWLAESERTYGRLLRLVPAHPVALTMRARLSLLKGDLAAGAAGFRRALEIAPTLGEAGAGVDRCRRYARLAAMAGDPVAPSGLAVRGSFRDTSGYAHMTRRFVRGLAARGVAQQLLDVQLNFVPLFDRAARAADLEAMAEAPVAARAMLNFTIPSMVEKVPGLTPLCFTMFEARTAPPSWARYAAGRLPLLIVPSLSSRDAWIEAGYPARQVRLCPLGVDIAPPGSVAPTIVVDAAGRRLADYPARILNVSDLSDRKNIDGLIRVWLRATRPGDGAALVLKLGKGQDGERERAARYLHQVAASVGKPLAQAAPVFLVQGVLSDKEMSGVFAACTHYWSMSHGEGWDLPMSRAGVMGRRLIAPDHSAYQAYLDRSVARMIPSAVGPAHLPFSRDPWPVFRGLDWWEPDEDAAAEIIGRVARGEDAAAPLARDRLLRDFTWGQATDRLQAILAEIGG